MQTQHFKVIKYGFDVFPPQAKIVRGTFFWQQFDTVAQQ